MSLLVKKCCNCRSDLVGKDGISVNGAQCEKCQKNQEKYGSPTTCKFCQLPAAFHEEKCVFCSHSERKFGAPVSCANCKLRAAFSRDGKIKHKPVLCRMCIIQARSNKQSTLAGVHVPSKDRPSVPSSQTHKRKRDEKSADESTSKTARRDPLNDSGENVLLVQQLRDQIAKLNGVIQSKDQNILEKDKKIAALTADLASAERKHREKFQQLLKEREEAVQTVHEKYRQASKQAKK